MCEPQKEASHSLLWPAGNWNGTRGGKSGRETFAERREKDGTRRLGDDFHQIHKWRLLISSRDNSTRPELNCASLPAV